MTTADTKPFEAFAIIELFGHQRIAGRLTEQTIGGANFLRVDVPEVNGYPGFTKLFTQGAIYAINFVDEAVAKMAAANLRLEPVRAYQLSHVETNEVRRRLTDGYADSET